MNHIVRVCIFEDGPTVTTFMAEVVNGSVCNLLASDGDHWDVNAVTSDVAMKIILGCEHVAAELRKRHDLTAPPLAAP